MRSYLPDAERHELPYIVSDYVPLPRKYHNEWAVVEAAQRAQVYSEMWLLLQRLIGIRADFDRMKSDRE
jgi:hypothetical protein